jgi:hypothetical protein
MPWVLRAVVSSASEATPVASMLLFCRAGSRAASSSTKYVMLSSSGGFPHHLSLRVRVIRCAVRSSPVMMNGPAEGPG